MPFYHGDPGSMESVPVPLSAHHAFTAFEIISGPLSARRCTGVPRIAVISSGTPVNSMARSP